MTPIVVYNDGKEVYISNPVEFPEVSDSKMKVSHVEEPMSKYWPCLKCNESPLMNVQKLMPLYLSPTACIPCQYPLSTTDNCCYRLYWTYDGSLCSVSRRSTRIPHPGKQWSCRPAIHPSALWNCDWILFRTEESEFWIRVIWLWRSGIWKV